MAKLDAWSVHPASNSNAFKSPTSPGKVLRGVITGHPRWRDGVRRRTSPIVATQGRSVTTSAGSVYELGEPHPDYVAWLAKHGHVLDPVCPVLP